jgi:HlyB family type I secretion system ABC transporter
MTADASGRAVLDSLPLLSFLTADVRQLVADSFVPVEYAYGDVIFSEGDAADALFVVAAGRARVLKGSGDAEVSLNVLSPGDSFGETALLRGGARTATVRASSDVTVFRLDAGVFRALAARDPRIAESFELGMRRQSLGDLLRLSSPFAGLSTDGMRDLLQELRPVSVAAGEIVCRQGDAADRLDIVEEGRLRIGDDGSLAAGDVVGERELLTGAPVPATVEALVDSRLLRLDKESFDRLAERHPSFKAQIAARAAQYDYRRQANVSADVEEELLPADAEAEVAQDAFDKGDGLFVKRGERIRRFKHIRQVDEADCGAAALAMVCRYFGARVSLARVRTHVGTGIDGTSLRGLARGGEDLGLATRALKVSLRNLEAMPLPAILHWGGNHWVVLTDVDAKGVKIADPALGIRRLSRAELEKAWSGYAVLFARTDRVDELPASPSGFAWLRPFARRFWRPIAGAVGLAMVVSALNLALPVLTQIVVDRVLGPRDFELLETLVLAMAGVLVVSVAASYVQRLILSRAAVGMDAETLDHVAAKMLALPMPYFYARRTGDLQRRLIGMRQVRQFLVQNSVVAITSAMQLLVAVVLMFIYSPVLGGIFMAAAPLYVLLMRFAVRRIRPLNDSLEEAFSDYHSLQVDAVKGIETVKALGGEDALRRAMVREYRGLSDRQLKVDMAGMAYDGAVQALTFVSLVAFLWFGSLQVLDGSLTIGGLVSFSALVVLANGPIAVLLGLFDDLQMASVLLSRLSDIFEEAPEQGEDRSGLRPVPSLEGRVRLDNVGFHYGGPDSPDILSGISFEVAPGSTVAIVGRSGSGKTTLVKLLAGLVEPTDGSISYDGVDMRTLDYRELRRHVGVVLQESFLFADTLARNIAFGEPEPDMARVVRAATIASAHEFITRLPMGYDTRVGETGLLLSGGQRQRIAIARAVYHEPPVLLFDEATSSLDTEAERAVQDNMSRLLSRRTSFVIAHRLSTIRNADVILVLERGRLVETGTHDELIAAKGLYFYLSSQQLDL